ncbi:inactive receptor-like serine/threonine-protein kinase At2g40270 isoform X2 [Silene latifolia]|uniref:inactive receptor-like serine/threonine-protein kinase At2g40270 isoform X2 n=1 Tax=Silene latifolia TaxID=37657 RepID=UPI003D783140
MLDFWSINGFIILVFIGVFQLNASFIWSLNDEGIALLKFKERVVNDPFEALTSWNGNIGETCPCSWFGIQCDDGHVISLNLENLCLEGTLAPELQHLLYIKSIILRNNSFSGMIPKEIVVLKELKLLNLAYNNLRRPFPHEFEYDIPILLLDNNGQSCHISSQLENLALFSDTQGDEKKLTSPMEISSATRQYGEKRAAVHSRRLKELNGRSSTNSPPLVASNSGEEGLPPPPQSPSSPDPSKPPPTPERPNFAPPSLDNVPSPPPSSSTKKSQAPIFVGVGAGLGFIVLSLAIGVCFWRGNKVRNKADSPKGLTGQLQKAFVSGVQNLRRFELDTACEDFSNVIGTCSIGKINKGTLSNGVEIAVISLAVSSAKDWSKNLESQFRKKIETLSKVHHKNFINLIGYCEEEEPFTRMMVFEYAPNGSLFEHLHVREAEHLDWGMRLRVGTGMANCLEHMHQLSPPVTHPNLNSASIHLSEDYAAKISDFCFWNEVAALQVQPIDLANLRTSTTSPQSNVYSYGLVMLEMITGRIPHTVVSNEAVDDWVSEYLSGEKPVQELVDPMLRRFKQDQLEKVSEVIKNCLHSEPQLRPTMKDVCTAIKEITGIDREKAGPRLSPLWWSELESRGSVNGEQPA